MVVFVVFCGSFADLPCAVFSGVMVAVNCNIGFVADVLVVVVVAPEHWNCTDNKEEGEEGVLLQEVVEAAVEQKSHWEVVDRAFFAAVANVHYLKLEFGQSWLDGVATGTCCTLE